jgi:hypothetical protein
MSFFDILSGGLDENIRAQSIFKQEKKVDHLFIFIGN